MSALGSIPFWGGVPFLGWYRGGPSRYTHPPWKGPRTRHTHISSRRDLGPGIPLLDSMTHTCKNITFPQRHWHAAIIRNIITVRKSSFGKVMFSQVSVCPRGGVHPSWADTPRGKHPHADTPSADTPPKADTPRQTTTPQQMATAADGMHPTGMHSC